MRGQAMNTQIAVTVVGNCQGEQIAACLRRMLPTSDVEFVRYFAQADLPALVASGSAKGGDRILLVQNPVMSFRDEIETLRETLTVLDFPAIVHAGFHPDLIRPKIDKTLIKGPLGSNHSALVLHAFLRGLDEQATRALFCEEVFASVGYFDARAESDRHLRAQLTRFDLFDEAEFAPLLAGGCFMHNTIHPRLPVIAAVARVVLRKAGISPALRYPENFMADELANNVIWPVYPEIARFHGVQGGEYAFQFKPTAKHTYDLERFIEQSFVAYRGLDIDSSCHARLTSPEFKRLEAPASPAAVPASNPYRDLPDHHFWRRAVAAVGHDHIDPVVRPPFMIERETAIGTAGSCFAQHIARRLAMSGHHYLVTEDGATLSPSERSRKNYGVYSARYGNLYTARQLRQLFERAHGTYTPADSVWRREDARFVDPFRPEIDPDGFATPDEVEISRQEHFAAVRQLFREVDVLVFTLGLTEAWQSCADGSVFPLCPMVVSSAVSAGDYAPVNFSYAEILDDLMCFVALLRSVNPAAKLLLTVSPVPLIATFEDRHVMVSTTASKSILRAVADEACRLDPGVSYFPSYEIVANPFFPKSYFGDDARSVKPEGVDHVMRVFLAHYSRLGMDAPHGARIAELEEEQKVVCEEERLDV